MKVSQTEKCTIIVDDQSDLVSFLMKLTHEFKTFYKQNIVVDLTLYDSLAVKQINGFLKLSDIHKKNKKSFVVVAKNVNFTAISEKLTVVPTIQEAHDMIEMDEIERDLGF